MERYTIDEGCLDRISRVYLEVREEEGDRDEQQGVSAACGLFPSWGGSFLSGKPVGICIVGGLAGKRGFYDGARHRGGT